MPEPTNPRTIDEYLASVAPEQRVALERLRSAIRTEVPEAEECISYGVAAFRLGRVLVGFGASSRHCAFYLWSGATLADHAALLRGLDTSKGTIRFTPDQPLPDQLVRTLVRARIAENEARGRGKVT